MKNATKLWAKTDRQISKVLSHAASLVMETLESRLLMAIDQPPYLPPQHQAVNLGSYLTPPSARQPLDIAMEFLKANSQSLGMAPTDVVASTVTDKYRDADTGVTHIYLRQLVNKLEVSNCNFVINIDGLGRVINAGGGFVNGLSFSNESAIPKILAADALVAISDDLGLSLDSRPRTLESEGGVDQSSVLSAPKASLDPIPARLHYVATPEGLDLAWDLVLRTPDGDHWYNVSVNTDTGALVQGFDWVEHATYNVFPQPLESPYDGPRQGLVDPFDPVASPFGWHDTNGVMGPEFTDTRGNNVSAQEDTDANNVGGFRPDGGASLNFDFPLDLTLAPSGYQSAAISNLFYWNNLLHDVHYKYGFTEATGNFQINNYGKGGVGSDGVMADAQDGSGTNNANFATPPDGSAPRMQMFVFTAPTPDRDGDLDNGIIVHEYGHGVTNRLTGGPANSNALSAIQSGGMGEGWSDWWALMFTVKATDVENQAYPMGTYALGQVSTGPGIRRQPYSYNLTIDPITFAAYNSSNEVHNVGEIWSSALWDMAWLLMDKYGFNPTISQGYSPGGAGNLLAMKLVMDALKLQPANPSFTQARDAIIQADTVLTGGANLKEIWTAFARRGLGLSANAGTSSSTSVTTAFDLPILGLSVASTVPAAGSTIATQPTDFVVNFTSAYTPASVDASDFKVNGVSASSFVLNDSDTITFHFNTTPIVTQGVQTLSIAAGAMTRQSDGSASLVFNSTLRWDLTPIAVTSTVPVDGSLVTLPLTSIDVNFNEPFAAASIGASDLTLNRGTVTGFTLLDADTVRFTVSGLNSEGNLTLNIAAGAITDAFGNIGSAYSGTLFLDAGTVAFPIPLTAVAPLGSLTYTGTASGTIGGTADTDTFTLALDPGQTLTLIVTPAAAPRAAPALRAAITLTGPGVFATGSSSAAGKDAVLQSAAISGGLYSITISGLLNTIGAYTIQAYVNASVEDEDHGGATNDTRATAQNIDASAVAIGGSSSRLAVIGSLPSTAGIAAVAENFETGTLGPAWSTYSSVAGGRVQVSGAYSTAGGSYALWMDRTPSGTLTLNEAVWNVNLTGVVNPSLAFSAAEWSDEETGFSGAFTGHFNADGVAISADGVNWYPLWSAPDTTPGAWTSYTFNLATAAASAGISLGNNFKIRFQQYDDFDLTTDGRGWDNIAITTPAPSEDWYRFDMAAGSAATIGVKSLGGPAAELELQDASGAALARGAVSGSGFDRSVARFVSTSGGTYYARISGGTGASYQLLVLKNADFDNEPNDTLATAQPVGGSPATGPGRVLGSISGAGVATGGVKMGLIQDSLPWGKTSNTTVAAALNYAVTMIPSSALGAIDLSAFNLIVLAGDQSATTYANVQSNMGRIESWVSGGGVWIANNAAAATNPYTFDLLPGAAGVTFTTSTGAAIDVLAPSSGLINGPGGTITNTTLDGGTSSYHGYTVSSLPAGSVAILSTATATQVVAFDYVFGSGHVITDTIPIEFYNATGNFAIFHTNLFNFGASVITGGAGDFYKFTLAAGQTVRLSTQTPGDGADEVNNPLNPALQLYDSAGNKIAFNDNGAADGRNALLSYTAAAAGIYYVQVVSATTMPVTSGEFVLTIDSAGFAAAPFVVSATTPISGSSPATTPTEIVVDFSDSVLLTSVQAGDMLFDGVPLSNMTVIDGNTVSFRLPTGLAQGLHTFIIAAGSIADIHNTPINGFSGTFSLDSLPPRVIASSIAENEIRAPGSLTYVITFSKPMLKTNLDSTDFRLNGNFRGIAYTASGFAYDASGTVLTLNYSALPDDRYTLTLVSGNGRFESAIGLDLDGDGNSIEGGDYVLNVSVDAGTLAYPTPLPAKNPRGSLVYDPTVTSTITFPGDTDSFTVNLDAGQTMTWVVEVAAPLQPTLTLTDPSGGVIATATSAGPGLDIVLQTIPMTTAGTYTVTVGGVGASTGSYMVQLILNAAVSSDNHEGPANSSFATAQNLDANFSGLPGGASRGASIGIVSGEDWYKFTLAPGQSASVSVNNLGGTISGLELRDSTNALLASGIAGSTNVDRSIADFVSTAGGTYFARVVTSGSTTYNLLVTRGASFDTEANDAPATAQVLQSSQSSGQFVVLGAVTSGVDVYSFTAAAGAVLSFKTSTPGDGAGEPANTLNPRLRLLNISGTLLLSDDNSAPDGRNAVLNYTVATAGGYLIEVSSSTLVNTTGDYILTIGGASAESRNFAVSAVTPATGAAITVAPTTLTLDFNDTILISSIQAADLKIDGIPANSFTLVDQNTIIFNIPALTSGLHTISVAAGTILDLQGTQVQAFQSTFTLDTTAPRVVLSSIQDGEVRAAGNLAYTVTFNKPMLTSNLDASDIGLQGLLRGGSFTPSTMSWDATGKILTINYIGLPEDSFRLTLLSGNGRFEDAGGIDLDGEPVFPIPPNQSGNGFPGGNFILNFVTDAPTTPYPTPLLSIGPRGSLIYDPSVTGVIGSAGDTDSFTITLDSGQLASVVLKSVGGLRGIVELLNPSNVVIGAATAGAAGQDAVIQGAAVASPGVYTIRVSGATSSVGIYTAQLFLNANVEDEEHNGAGNNSRASAQNIESSFLTLSGTSRRGAVLGKLSSSTGATQIFGDNFETGTLGPAWSTYSSLAQGRIQLTGAFTTAGGSYAMLMDRNPGTGLTLNEAVWTVNLAGVVNPTLTFAAAEWNDEQHPFGAGSFIGHYNADGVAISADGNTWYPLWSAADTAAGAWSSYTFNLATAAGANGITVGNNFKIKFQQYDDNPLTTDGRGWDNVGITIPLPAGDDWYSFNLAAGQSASVVATKLSAGSLAISLVDSTGAALAWDTDSFTNVDQAIEHFVAPAAGTYYLRLSGSDAEYSLLVNIDTVFDLENNSSIETAQNLWGHAALGSLLTGVNAVTGSGPTITGPIDIVGTNLSIGFAADGSLTGPAIGVKHRGIEYIRWGTYVAGYTVSFNGVNYTNKTAAGNGTAFPVVMQNLSSGSTHAIKITGTINGLLFERLWKWIDGDNFAFVTTTLTNKSGATLNNLALLENQDPDPNGVTVTNNDVTPSGDMVIATGAAGAIGLGSADPRRFVSAEGFVVSDPFEVINSPVDPNNAADDIAINLAFKLGALAPGQSTTSAFVMVMGANANEVMNNYSVVASQTAAGSSDEDYYSFNIAAGETIRLITRTPADGAGEFVNVLDTSMELFGPAGQSLVVNEDGAPDGRNALISYTATTAGIYRLLLTGRGSGEYVLLINRTPVAASDNLVTLEDQAATISPLANDTDGDGDTLTVSSTTNPAHGGITLNADSTITYAPAANYFGSDSFTYTIVDASGASATATVNVTVTPVNDAPSFSKGADLTVGEDAGVVAVAGWATFISAGPGEIQGLTFIVTADHPELFAVQPTVDASGKLAFKTADNISGAASVTVVLKDDGGLANGGIDTSAPQSFTITLTPVADAPMLTVANAAGDEGAPIGLSISTALVDTDGSESLSVTVSGVPSAATLSKGINQGGGVWALLPADLPGLTITTGDNGTYSLVVTATSTEAGNGAQASTSGTIQLVVSNVAPRVSPIMGRLTGVRGQSLSFTASFTDPGYLDTHEISWSFGDGSSVAFHPSTDSSALSAAKVFTATGVYQITMFVRDDDGAVTSVSTRVAINVYDTQVDPGDPSKTALVVGGTLGDDQIHLNANSKGISLKINGVNIEGLHPTGRIIVYGLAGNDSITISSGIDLPTELYGGDGNDTLNGGSGPNIVVGGNGNDVIIGGQVRDLLIGGHGRDNITGGPGDDLLIGGFTDYDEDPVILRTMFNGWLNTDRSYQERVADLTSGVGTGGSYKFTGATIHDDADRDVLAGSSGNDWFFRSTNLLTGDAVTDWLKDEMVMVV